MSVNLLLIGQNEKLSKIRFWMEYRPVTMSFCSEKASLRLLLIVNT